MFWRIIIIGFLSLVWFSFTKAEILWDAREIDSFERLLGVDNLDNFIPDASVVEVDVIDAPESYIRYLKNHWKIVVGYINVWAIEDYREDINLFPKDVIGKIYPGWEDERFLDIGQYHRFKDRMVWRLNVAKQKWFDAIEFDNIDIYDDPNTVGFDISKEDMIAYLNRLLDEAHSRDLRVLQKNAPELINSLSKEFDGALIEDGRKQGWAHKFKDYVAQNKPVFAVEYMPEVSVSYFKQTICPQLEKWWYVWLVKNLDLDQWSVHCPNKTATKYIHVKSKINKILANYITHQLSKKSSHWLAGKLRHYANKLKNHYTKGSLQKWILDYLIVKLDQWAYNLEHIKLQPPSDWFYFGAFQFFGNQENLVSKERLTNFQHIIGFRPTWAYFSLVFDQQWIKFPLKDVDTITKFWEIPFLRLIPTLDLNVNKYEYSLINIARGKYDSQIIKLAQDIKAYWEPILIDFAPEANGNWFPWSQRPNLFKQAYRHIIDIFRQQQVENVTWFYHFNLPSYPNESWNNPLAYYPGDEYIDRVGFSLYGPLYQGDDFNFPSRILKDYLPILKKFAKVKPLAVLEFGINANLWTEVTKSWYKDFFQAIGTYSWVLNLKAISFWYEKWQNEDWSISNLSLEPYLLDKIQSLYLEGILKDTSLFAGEIKK